MVVYVYTEFMYAHALITTYILQQFSLLQTWLFFLHVHINFRCPVYLCGLTLVNHAPVKPTPINNKFSFKHLKCTLFGKSYIGSKQYIAMCTINAYSKENWEMESVYK